MSTEYFHTIETLAVEKGHKQGDYWFATLTTKEIAERLGKPATAPEYNLILHLVRSFYPDSNVKRANGDAGWEIGLVIRTK